jgi:hypothetical protein
MGLNVPPNKPILFSALSFFASSDITKITIPVKFQTPNSKSQTNPKFPFQMIETCEIPYVENLDFEY